jgi:hypothetical protein
MMLPRPPSWTARLVGPALACLLLTGVGARAQTQQITPDPPSQEAASGATLGIGVDYTASDRQPAVDGLGTAPALEFGAADLAGSKRCLGHGQDRRRRGLPRRHPDRL